MAYLQMFSLWFGMNLVVENIVIAFLGPLVFSLGWKDCVCIVIFANALACSGVAYTSTFGAQSGNRTMVCRALPSCLARTSECRHQKLTKDLYCPI